MKIESQDQTVEALLKGTVFVIPSFQRPYSWEIDHINKFWDDILENIDDTYFIGSMVVYKGDRSKVFVVDGQQRLTTIAILLCALREGFKSIGATDLAEGIQTYIQQRDRDARTVYVLKTETSFPYLQEEVLKDGPATITTRFGDEERAIERAFSEFKKKIAEGADAIFGNLERTPEENKSEVKRWLTDIRDTVLDLNVIVVTLDNESDAYTIFETLNTRGKDLALTDLLRNHFKRMIDEGTEVDHATLKWRSVIETIRGAPSNLDPDEFVVHSWQSRYDFVTKAKAFAKAKERIVDANAEEHLNRFLSDAEHWRSIFDPDFSWNGSEKEVVKSLRALRIFKVKQSAPGVLSLIRAYRDGIIRYRKLRDAIKMIEKFHFTFNAVTSSRSSGGISGMFASFGKQVFNCRDAEAVDQVLRDLKVKLRSRVADPDEFDANFRQITFTRGQTSQKELIRYILKKVQKEEGSPTVGESDDLTIEHLLPQSSDRDASTVGQIGNLILVDKETNDRLADKDFNEKKLILAGKGYRLPEMLTEVVDLTDEVIEKNTLRISELSRSRVWRI
ncbi:DUF262 domain-containing protein [Sulfitobacter sp. 1A13368]|uniref:DUF262 domain-containing protein n=1 Tax=Sulfitobacter sp. 1A13368 TaxID=3368593 RepID=UPI003745D2C0